MKVFKFGGESINSVERIQRVGEILKHHQQEKIVVVVSAMGKTTNALEKVAQAFYKGEQEQSLLLFEEIKQQHLTVAKYLLITNYLACERQLKDFFTEAEWLLHDKPVLPFDYYYDQIVCMGELMSSLIVSCYLEEIGFAAKWFDVRDIIRTDNYFRQANVEMHYSQEQVCKTVLPALEENEIVLTQGFIGATTDNESTTLGREGSDYSAALFAYFLQAESVTIWKDVPAVMNADPKLFPEAKTLPVLSYKEVIEMAYYGAQVIHPKTIKPLQNKQIQLLVKSFKDPNLPGTIVQEKADDDALPPMVVLKSNQVLVEITTNDYSFVSEFVAGRTFLTLEEMHIKPSLTQHEALKLSLVLDDFADTIEQFAATIATFATVQIFKELTLLTVRHYTGEYYNKITFDRKILIQQKTPITIQALMA